MTELAKPVGLGFGLLGTSNTMAITDADAEHMFSAARDLAVVRFDTAPLYGGGLSEERLGRLLRGIPRNDFVLSTKVGRYRPYAAKVTNPKDNPGDWYDYSADATKRAVEASLKRLGTDRLDIVFVHDCDVFLDEATEGAFPVLDELKSQGVIGAVGCGSNHAATHDALLHRLDLDVVMVAGCFTLLDQSATKNLFPHVLRKGVAVELAAPFNSGILATGTGDPTTRFNYMTPDADVLDRVRAIEAVCADFGIDLKRAALGYSAAHPAVTRLVLGLIHPQGLASNLDDLRDPPPQSFWTALGALGIPDPTTQATA